MQVHGMGSSRRGNLSIPWGLQGVWKLKLKLSPGSWGCITSVSLAHVVLKQFPPVAPVGFEPSLGAAAEATLHFGTLGTQGVVLGLSKGQLCVVLESGKKILSSSENLLKFDFSLLLSVLV